MKKLKLFALGLIGVSTLTLTSCAEDDDDVAIGPEISVESAAVVNNDGNYEIAVGESITFNWVARKGDADLEYFTVEDGSGNTPAGAQTDGGEDLPIDNLNAGDETTYSDSWTISPNAANTYTYSFVVRDEDGLEDEETVTIEVSDGELSAAMAFTWQRDGGDPGTGLDQFGLAWENNTAANAIVKTDAADKMVILNSSDWTTITTVDDLMDAVDNGNGVADYRGVSVQQDASYDDVLGVKLNDGKYFLIHVTNGVVTTAGTGTTITVDGEYKENE